jgi:hypothetical protein
LYAGGNRADFILTIGHEVENILLGLGSENEESDKYIEAMAGAASGSQSKANGCLSRQ